MTYISQATHERQAGLHGEIFRRYATMKTDSVHFTCKFKDTMTFTVNIFGRHGEMKIRSSHDVHCTCYTEDTLSLIVKCFKINAEM